jgi:hypothetical protein
MMLPRRSLLAGILGISACARQPPPPSAILVIPLRDARDRTDLTALLHHHATEHGLTFVDVSAQYRQLTDGRLTLYLGLYRGDERTGDLEVLVENMRAPTQARLLFQDYGSDSRIRRMTLVDCLQKRWPAAHFEMKSTD